jgi:hypothetical protein
VVVQVEISDTRPWPEDVKLSLPLSLEIWDTVLPKPGSLQSADDVTAEDNDDDDDVDVTAVVVVAVNDPSLRSVLLSFLLTESLLP